MAPTMMRLRPRKSEMMPTKGATSATEKVMALTVRLTSAGLAANSWAKSGRSDWVA